MDTATPAAQAAADVKTPARPAGKPAAAPPLLTIRPYFDQTLAMVQSVPVTIVGTLVLTLGLGTLIYILLMIVGIGRFIPSGYIYGLCLIASLVALPPLFFEAKKRAFQRTVFRFFPGHLEYQYFRFYVMMRRGRVRYADIADIAQRSGPLQGQRLLSDITIYVPAMAYYRGFFPGVKIEDLPQRQDYMSRIMQVLDGSAAARTGE